MGAVLYQFQASGQDAVLAAFKSIAEASNKTTQAVVKHAQIQARAYEVVGKRVVDASKSADEERIRNARQTTSKIISEYERQASAAERAADKITRASARASKSSFSDKLGSSVGGFTKGLAIGGVTAVAGGAAALIGGAARESMKLQELATRISIGSRGHGEAYVDPTTLRKEFEATAIKTPGITSEQVAEGVAGFVGKTGRLDIARSMQGTFATAASASGANFEDISNAAADLFSKFDISSIKDMQDAFAKLIYQGKDGSFELKDAASQFGRLSAAASRFNIGQGAGAVATLGGLSQIARSSTGSSRQAATAVERVFTNLTTKAGKLSAAGVNVFDKSGKARDIQDVLAETITKVGGGDLAKKKGDLAKIFGAEGIRALSPLIAAFEKAFSENKGTDKEKSAAGEAAVRDVMKSSIDAAGTWGDVVQDASMAQKTASAQLAEAWEQVKQAVGEKVTPALIELAPRIKDMVPAVVLIIRALGAFVDWLKTIPGVNKLFEEQDKTEERQKTYQAKQDELNAKIAAREASPWHNTYEVGEDPVIGKYNEQLAKLDEEYNPNVGGVPTKDEFVQRLLGQAQEDYRRAGNEKGFLENKDAFRENYSKDYDQLVETKDTRDLPLASRYSAPGQQSFIEGTRDKLLAEEQKQFEILRRTIDGVNKSLGTLASTSEDLNRTQPFQPK